MSVSLKPLGLQSEDSRQPTSGSVGRAASARSPTASDKSSALKTEEAVVQLVLMAMKLFQNMVDSSADFHLTLLDVCFSNLQTRGAGGAPSHRSSRRTHPPENPNTYHHKTR
ncbi:uncharacterized protein [Nothobranchius furzeri]